MNIYIDESGSFVNSTAINSWNSVAGYVRPESDRRQVSSILRALKRSANAAATSEIKLKQVKESEYLKFLGNLGKLRGVFFAVATDAGRNHIDDVIEHQKQQCKNVVAHKDKLHHQVARDALQRLSDTLGSIAPQLYLQLHCQVILIDRIFRNATLFYVQRQPKTLAHFRWRIDQKSETRTEYEKAFLTLVPPILQTMSIDNPVTTLEGADYSAFSRFDYASENRPTYLRDDYGIELDDSEPVTNIGLIITEDLDFVNSKESEGVQVADLLVSGLRRCLRKDFKDNARAAHLLGCLMIQDFHGNPPVKLVGFSREGDCLGDDVAHLVRIMAASSRPMLAR